MFILLALLLIAVPATGKLFRWLRTESTVSGIQRVLNVARLEAVRRSAQVVVLVEQGTGSSPIQLTTFLDANLNFQLDGGERVLSTYDSGSSRMVYWKYGDATATVANAILFDEYTPPGATGSDASLTRRVVFLGNGGIVAPAASSSVDPLPTAGRGIYVADDQGTNFFRVTVYSEIVSKPVMEKYEAGSSAYVVGGWTWY